MDALRQLLHHPSMWIIALLVVCCVLLFATEALRSWRVAREQRKERAKKHGYDWSPAPAVLPPVARTVGPSPHRASRRVDTRRAVARRAGLR